MKHSVLLTILAVVLASCAKTAPATVAVTLNISNVRSGEIGTKGSAAAILSVSAPTGTPTLRLTSTTNSARVYDVTPGVAVNLPCDTYNVTGRYTPAKVADVLRGACYHEPRYHIDTQLTISENEDTYNVAAQYDCIAIIADFSEVDHYTHSNANASQVDMPYLVSDGFGILYVFCTSAWTSDYCYRVTSYPANTAEYEVKQYPILTSGTGGVLVQPGRWYSFSPAEVDKQTGNIGTTLPEWQAGVYNY